tara:strand:- start:62 stop:274 length:213 start_codon:yes stop_codon:yes gene_type:complete
MKTKTYTALEINRMLSIFFDIKKELVYNKFTDLWDWHDRGEGHCEEDYQFDTAMEAIEDAISPYIEVDES